ncbi:MAG: hypothetical protein KatS3mg110_1638 [Pirellulaceae bacterium]|nr:MAG: hypothetical protein KatS3mg110_1638 [Pirellulaceae bacterium]
MNTPDWSWPRCRVVPLPDYQVAFEVDGQERLRWHFGRHYPRPFFYPLRGPSGQPLTRMGHPGAPNHDHHRSIWFAHHRAMGIDFWSDTTPAHIRQLGWLAYQDGEHAAMAADLAWYDGHDPQPLLKQRLIVAVHPGPQPGETLVELDSEFRPEAEQFEFGQTNFGFLAVRVASHLSAFFGHGRLRDSEGRQGEKEIFGQTARWMDYSGPAPPDQSSFHEEGICYFDHPSNPRYPNSWHVRDDGWMGAAVCLKGPLTCGNQQPLRLRYLLWAHAGPCNPDQANHLAKWFADLPPWKLHRPPTPHRTWEIVRDAAG